MYKIGDIKRFHDMLEFLKIELIWQEREEQERNYRKQKNAEYFERLDNMINEEDIF